MNYQFTCPKCKLNYQIEGKYIIQKTSLECPNCNQKLSERTLSKLKALEEAFLESSKGLDDFLTVRVEGYLKGSNVSFK